MGARVIEKYDPRAARQKELRALAIIIAAVVGPLLLTYLLIAADMRRDLSGLKSREVQTEDSVTLIGWKDLEANDGASRGKMPSGRSKMLGYMMDGYRPVRDDTSVTMFILMPEAGQFLHPAHRVPDEMVEVWLSEGRSIHYVDRDLVWVEGNLRRVRGKATEGLASYAIQDAAVERASEHDTALCFAP